MSERRVEEQFRVPHDTFPSLPLAKILPQTVLHGRLLKTNENLPRMTQEIPSCGPQRFATLPQTSENSA